MATFTGRCSAIDNPGPCAIGPNQATSCPRGNATTTTSIVDTVTQAGSIALMCGTVQVAGFQCPAAPANGQSLVPVQTLFGYAQTTGVAAVTALTIAIPAGRWVLCQIVAIARLDAGAPNGAAIAVNQAWENNGGVVSAAAVQGAVAVTPRDVALATVNLQGTISGTNVLIQVLGVAATNIDWTVSVQVRMV